MIDLSRHVELEVEMTTRCNAGCTACARNLATGYTNPDLPTVDLEFDAYQQTVGQLGNCTVTMAGSYGEALLHPSFNQFIDYNDANKIKTFISTNGSFRTEEFWSELATKLVASKSVIIFSIDGLSDTNHLYRKRTDFAKIMRNAKAFIAAGGRARWRYLIFRHNEHQVDEARLLSEEMGFEKFSSHFSNRYVYDELKDKNPEQPTSQDVSWEQQRTPDTLNIVCKFKQRNKIFLDVTGKIIACCYLNNIYKNDSYTSTLEHKYGQYNDTRQYSLEDVLHSPYYDDLQQSWETGDNIPENCIFVCNEIL